MVAADDSILGSGRETFLFMCNVPESGMVIIVSDELTIFFNQCWYSYLMKYLDTTLSNFNPTRVLLVFNI